MGFVRILWKNNIQEAYLPKISIWGQIVSETLAQLTFENCIQTLLNLFWVEIESRNPNFWQVGLLDDVFSRVKECTLLQCFAYRMCWYLSRELFWQTVRVIICYQVYKALHIQGHLTASLASVL